MLPELTNSPSGEISADPTVRDLLLVRCPEISKPSATLNVPALESSPETETLAKDAFPLSEFLNTPALFSNEALTVPLFSKTACALLVKTLLLVSPSLWNEPSLIVSDSAEVSKRAFALLATVPCWTKEAAVPALSSSSSFPWFVRVPFLLTLRILTCSKALEAMSALPLKSTFQTANSPFLRFNEPFSWSSAELIQPTDGVSAPWVPRVKVPSVTQTRPPSEESFRSFLVSSR